MTPGETVHAAYVASRGFSAAEVAMMWHAMTLELRASWEAGAAALLREAAVVEVEISTEPEP